MKRLTLASALLSVVATASAAAADERYSTSPIDRRAKVDAYARAVGLQLVRSSDQDQLRLWVADVMFGRLYGFVTDGAIVHVCDTTYVWSQTMATVRSGRCVPSAGGDRARDALELLGGLAKLDGSSIDCGVMDGFSVDIEGRFSGRTFAFWSGNPQSCHDPSSKLVAKVLTLLRSFRPSAT
jgi:hypothetical protein